MVVDLVKAGEIFEKSYSLESIDIDSIAKIGLSYKNEITEKTDSAEFIKYELDGNEYILQNFPLEKVDVFHLYRGIMEYEFISCNQQLCLPKILQFKSTTSLNKKPSSHPSAQIYPSVHARTTVRAYPCIILT